MKQFNLLLLLPPLAEPYYSDAALPYLTSFLKSKKLKVAQRDVNIEVIDTLLSKSFLSNIKHRLQTRINYYTKKKKLTFAEMRLYKALMSGYLCIPYAIDNLEDVRRILRNKKEFYTKENLIRADRTFSRAFKSISALYYPTEISLNSLEMNYDFSDEKGIKQAVYDNNSNIFVDIFRIHIVPSITKIGPAICGIVVNSEQQIIPAFTLARLLRESLPSLHIFIFGDYFSSIAKQFMPSGGLFDLISGIILHAPEKPLLKIFKNLFAGKDFWRQVPNLVYRTAMGNVRMAEMRMESTLAHLRFPDFAGINFKQYFSPEAIIPLLTARKDIANDYFMERAAAEVANDMKHLNDKYGIGRFSLTSCHNSLSFLDSLSKLILKKKLLVKWGCRMSMEGDGIKSPSKAMLKRLYGAGCRKIWLDLDPFSQAISCPISRRIRKVSNLLRLFEKNYFAVHLDIKLGYPIGKKNDALETIDLILRRRKLFETVGSTINIERFSLKSYMPSLRKIKKIPSLELSDVVSSPLDATIEFYSPGSLSDNQITLFEEYLIRICEVALSNNPFLIGFETFAFLYLLESIKPVEASKPHLEPGNLPTDGKDFLLLVPEIHRDVRIKRVRSDALKLKSSSPRQGTFLCYHPMEDELTGITPYQNFFLQGYFYRRENFQKILKRYCAEQKKKVKKKDALAFLKMLLQKNILVA